ncbi:hypothetical protein INT48_008244, partial [Thamnidium elegans]
SQVEALRGSHYTMHRNSDDGKIFVCAYHDKKVKSFVSSCGTTRMTPYKRTEESNSHVTVISRPDVIDEYGTHKSSVDTANNRRDNLISYHDVISTERWEMRFLGFILGICKANAFSCYKVFAEDGEKMGHSAFKDIFAFRLLKHCEALTGNAEYEISCRTFRSDSMYNFVRVKNEKGLKRRKLTCRACIDKGISGTRVEKCSSCNPDIPLCQKCYHSHLLEVGKEKTIQ